MLRQHEFDLPPSKVLHIRNGSNDNREIDLNVVLPFLSGFGSCVYVVTMPRLQQAIVEMDSIESAKKVIEASKGNIIDLKEQKVYIEYSKSGSINREPSFRRSMFFFFVSFLILHNIIIFFSILIFVVLTIFYFPSNNFHFNKFCSSC